MKKILLMVVGVFAYTFSNGQCTPDQSLTYPTIEIADSYEYINADGDTLIAFPDAHVNAPYSADIQIKLPGDTIVSGIPALIESITTDSISGLPTGFTYARDTEDCAWTNEIVDCAIAETVTGCINVSGAAPTVDMIGAYPLTIDVTISSKIYNCIYDIPQANQITNFILFVAEDNSALLEFTGGNKFEVLQNIPNPFTHTTDIAFSSPEATAIVFEVYDVLGNRVHAELVQARMGTNKVVFDGSLLKTGIYMYTLNNGKQALSARMLISK